MAKVESSRLHAPVAETEPHAAGSSPVIAAIDARLRAVEQLINIFRFERYIYLSISIVSFIILVTFAIYIFVTEQEEGRKYIFGVLFAVPSGAMVYMGAAFLKMWTQALQALNEKAGER
jgi:hypothetical protein